MGKSNAIISAMEDTVRKSLLRVADPISGCSGGQNDFGNLEEIGKLFHLEGDFENSQKACDNPEKYQKCGRFRLRRGYSTTYEGKGKEMKNLQGRPNQLEKEIEQGEFKGLIIDWSK